MCTPFYPGLALFSAGVVAWVSAAALRRTRAAILDQRGFTVAEGLSFLAIVILLFLLAILIITTRCYRTAVPIDFAPIATRAGAIQIGLPQPPGTRAAACETGGYCTSPGKSCRDDKKCTDTYEWDIRVSEWRCGCECR